LITLLLTTAPVPLTVIAALVIAVEPLMVNPSITVGIVTEAGKLTPSAFIALALTVVSVPGRAHVAPPGMYPPRTEMPLRMVRSSLYVPAATHTVLGRPMVPARLMPICTVRKGAIALPVPVMSLPVGETCVQLQPSLTTPLQSSSIMLPQISATGAPGTHALGALIAHAGTMRWHAPTPHVICGSSSTIPSQSSSRPLHASLVGVISPVQTPRTLPTHMRTPATQTPRPAVPAGPE
jgi:hypothetical protein